MSEYRVLKDYGEWTAGSRLFPNTCMTEGQRRWLEENGYIIPASKYQPKTVDPVPVETAAFEPPAFRRRPGRPRKYDALGKLIESANGDSQDLNEEKHV